MAVYINERNLRFIGQGASSSVFTDGVYAIKIGHITQYDVDALTEFAKYNYAVRVIDYIPHCTVPAAFIAILTAGYKEWNGNCTHHVPTLYKGNRCPMLITELAKPFLKHGVEYSEVYKQRAYKRASAFRTAVYNKTGLTWEDSHPWNLGKRANGSLVILDV